MADPGPGESVRPSQESVCDVWLAPVPSFTGRTAALEAVLSGPERAEVRRRRHPGARTQALLSRALLRLLLGAELGQDPVAVRIDRRCPTCGGQHGRPRLPGGPHLSVSHCADLVLLAVDPTGPVGVDVEALAEHHGPVPTELLEVALTPAGRRWPAQVPPDQRWRAFLEVWTCQEAVLKRLGTGLVGDAAQPEGPAPASWAGTRRLDLGSQHVGTVATDAPAVRIRPLPRAILPA